MDMAGTFALNTTDHPSLTQVLAWTPTGLFDYKAQQAAGKVVVATASTQAALRLLKNPATGRPFLSET